VVLRIGELRRFAHAPDLDRVLFRGALRGRRIGWVRNPVEQLGSPPLRIGKLLFQAL
jgi:hypothetical protein